ncbi:TIGR01777 family oxidoreductase [Chryseolinea lacunae]|uniref:TIGR01777 family oxidoreductase n=1 Tax=Chryseolinea lacunae TaxID=2801331 RepID=UPI0034E1D808
MQNILITGASGMIGQHLTATLLARGHRVTHLGRSKPEGEKRSGVQSFTWNIEKRYIEPGAFLGVDTIIHLAGAGIADKPWTKERKREILESRTQSTQLLHDELKRGGHKVKTFLSASAIGFYGFEDATTVFTEVSPAGTDFLAQVTQRWEREVDTLSALGLRVVKIRIGIVLSTDGGVLNELMKPIKFYVGAPLGSGDQYTSWIHIDDLCGIFAYAAEHDTLQGPYNAVAPNPVTNKVLTKATARMMHRPIIIPKVPAFALRLLLGEMADLVLTGNKVSNTKILNEGFVFSYQTVEAALQNLLGEKQ